MVLSIEQGLLVYKDPNSKSPPYPFFQGSPLKHRFVAPGELNPTVHFKLFATYIFTGTSGATVLFPEMVDYQGTITGGFKFDQDKTG